MNLCDSCKKFGWCIDRKVYEEMHKKPLVGCVNHTPITRADLAARDAEIAKLRGKLAEWQTFRDMFADLSYHHSGMGCGIEDRGITDRYAACEHGWDCAMERVTECIPEEVEATEEAKP